MKIFIIHATAGAGHKKCAEAIYEYLKGACPENQYSLIDALDKTSLFYRFAYRKGYVILIKYMVWLWAFFFWLTEFKPVRRLSAFFARISNILNAQALSRFLINENPDFIISTHFLSPEIAGRLKIQGKITSNLITVVTDFGVHPFWVNPGTDLYIVASGITKNEMSILGVPEEKIKDSGIPVKESFLIKHDRSATCRKLGISPDKFTVLIMTGSFGIGPIREIVASLNSDAQLLVVCALNTELYNDLKGKDLSGVKVFGFVNNSDELMAVSDLIITKPGGLSISEILNTGLIPIFISSIPGQEDKNISVLLSSGIGFLPKDTEEIRSIVLDLKASPDKLKLLKENVNRLSKPGCLKDLANVVCEGSIRPAH